MSSGGRLNGKTAVEYRRVGKSGLRVSVPILGTMGFGTDRWVPWMMNADEALPVLKYAFDRGINTIDTANSYSNGESERIIAMAIKKYNIPRSKLVILAKCSRIVAQDPSLMPLRKYNPAVRDTRDYVNQSGLSRAAIFNAVDATLARLEMGYIDLLQVHRYDPDTPAEETMQALHDLIQAGKVRYIGACTMLTSHFAHYNNTARSLGTTTFVSMQSNYSLLQREEEREMIQYCKFAGIGLIPWAPLAQGFLARPFGTVTARTEGAKGTPIEFRTTKADEEIINRVEQLARDKGWTMAQIALAWLDSTVTSPIVGITSAERLEETIVTDKKLTAQDRQFLEEPYVPKPMDRLT